MQDPRYQAPITMEPQGDGGLGTLVPFEGFDPPESNFWRLPNNWFDLAARFTSWAEHKVVEYILRHTWGYHEYDIVKLITMDEFMHGRKRRDGSRLDAGCGMAENSIKKGIHDAVAHGFLIVRTDDSDKGRIKKYYAPRMRQPHIDEGQHSVHAAVAANRPPATWGEGRTPWAAPQPDRPRPAELRAAQHLLEGQLLTLKEQGLTPEGAPLTLQPATLTPCTFGADPRTEQTLSARHYEQETSSNKQAVVVSLPGPTTRLGAREAISETKSPPVIPVAARQRRAASAMRTAYSKGILEHRQRGQVAGVPEPMRADLVAQLAAEGVALARARQLVAEMPSERIERQIAWIERRSCRNRAATLVKAIVEDFGEPSRRVPAAANANADRTRYFRGVYALCPRCGSRPCVPECGEPDGELHG